MNVESLTSIARTQATREATSSSTAPNSGNAQPSRSSQASGSTGNGYYDVMDLNKDGYVSYYERVQYALMHPQTASLPASMTTQYNAKGQVSINTSQLPNLITVLA